MMEVRGLGPRIGANALIEEPTERMIQPEGEHHHHWRASIEERT
jgi:hypothetical protein